MKNLLLQGVGWDEAGFLGNAYKIGYALKTGNWQDFIQLTQIQTHYPFFHSWLYALPSLFSEFTVEGARLLSLVFFGLGLILIYKIGQMLKEGDKGKWVGIIASLLLATSPLALIFATNALREMPGLFLLLLGVFLYFKERFFLTGLTLAFLTLEKYNFGVLFGLTLALDFYLRLFLKPKNLFQKSFWKKYLSLALPFIVIFGVWVFYPQSKVLAVLETLQNIHPAYSFTHQMSALDHLLFYPKALAYSYTFSFLIFALMVLGFLSFPFTNRNLKAWFLYSFFTLNFVLATWHISNQQERFIFLSVPALFLITALQIVHFFPKVRGFFLRLSSFKKGFLGGLGVILGLLMLFDLFRLPGMIKPTASHTLASPVFNELDYQDRTQDTMITFNKAAWPHVYPPSGSENIKDALMFAVDNVDPRKPVQVFGYSNELSPGLFDLYLTMKGNSLTTSGAAEIDPDVASYTITIRIDENSRFYTHDYKMMNLWRLKNVAWVENEPSFRLFKKRNFEDLGISISVYTR